MLWSAPLLLLLLTVMPLAANAEDDGPTYTTENYFMCTRSPYYGPWWDYGGGIAAEGNGYILVGSTEANLLTGTDVYFVKTDGFGNQIWDKRVDFQGSDSPNDVLPVGDGYVIAGDGMMIAKVDSWGTILWSHTYGPAGDYSYANELLAADGGYLMVGSYERQGAGGTGYSDVYIIKTDMGGGKVWEKKYGNEDDEDAWSAIAVDDGYIIAGVSRPYWGGYLERVYLLKINKDGNKVWEKKLGGPEAAYLTYGIIDDGDGYVLTGRVFGNGGNEAANVYLLKTDRNGNKVWDKSIGGAKADGGAKVARVSDGYIIAGYTYSLGAGGQDAYLLKTDLSGNKLWDVPFGGPYWDYAEALAVTGDGYAMIGSSMLDPDYKLTGKIAIHFMKAFDDVEPVHDTTAPVTECSLEGTSGDNGWFASSVTVTLTPTDEGGSLLDETVYRFETGPTFTYSGSFTIHEQGQTTIYFKSRDRAGNEEEEKSVTFGIDVFAPETHAEIWGTPGDNGWYVGTAPSLILTADDGTPQYSSGVAATYFKIDNSPFNECLTPVLIADGTHEISYYSTDKAGNDEPERTMSIKVDTFIPTITATTPEGGASGVPAGSPVSATFSEDMDSATVAIALKDAAGTQVQGTTAYDVVTRKATFTHADLAPGVTCTATVSDAKDLAGNTIAPTSWTFSTVTIDNTAPVSDVSYSGAAGSNGWFTSYGQITVTSSDTGSGVDYIEYSLDGSPMAKYTTPLSISSDGAHELDYYAVDKSGNVETTRAIDVKVDTVKPTTGIALTGTAGTSGWYISGVQVKLTATDDTSGIALTEYKVDDGSWTPYPAEFTFSTEGAHTLWYRSTDSAGNAGEPQAAMVRIDGSVPAVTSSISGTEGSNGWYTTSVTVSLSTSDPTSGIGNTEYKIDDGDWQAYMAPFTIGEGEHTLAYKCVDNAGNAFTSGPVPIKIDSTAPVLTADVPDPNVNGWHNAAVRISFIATDATSGVATVTPEVTISTEGEGQSATGTATDAAGNIASITVSGINIDKTAPVITYTRTPANVNGWNSGDVTVTFAGTDALSGVASVTDTVTVSTEGEGQTVTGTVTDLAGNSASVTANQINIDRTQPAIIVSRTPEANSNGWNNAPVTVMFSATDAGGSGIDGADSDVQTISSDGKDWSVSWSVFDKAGNSAFGTVGGINIDTVAPVVSGAATTEPDINSWYNGDVVVHFTATDAGGSGLASVSPDATITGEGSSLSTTGTAEDLAGNTGTATVSGIRIDRTAPSIMPSYPASNGNGWYNGDVVVHYEVADDLSGIDTATIPADYTFSSDGPSQSTSATVSDQAGNVATASVSGINIDKTPPVITYVRTPEANAAGWNDEEVTVVFTATDGGGSGIVGQTTSSQTFGEGAGQSISWTATDAAGNSGSYTVTGINIDLTAPAIGMITVPVAPLLINTPAAVSATWTTDLSGVATATWIWGDGDVTPVIPGIDTVSGIHAYAVAGLYQINLAVTDAAGNSATQTSSFVTVYNPAAGMSQGNGWFNSPAGAYPSQPAMAEKAGFRFALQYTAGATVPEGNARLEIKAAGLNFQATSFEWLVINGGRATFQGTGTLNGAAGYTFYISYVDGNYAGGNAPDTIRVKIWDAEGIVYDNELGRPDTSTPITEVGGGKVSVKDSKGNRKQ